MKRYIFLLLAALMTLPMVAAKNTKSYWFQRAEEYYQKDDYESCLTALQAGVEEDAKDGYCWAVIAEICSKRAFAQYARALEASEMALKYLPKKDSYWLGLVYGIRGDIYYKVDEYALSAAAYEQAVKLQPDNNQYRFSLADVYRELSRYDEAEAQLKRILDNAPEEYFVQAVLAENYLDKGDTVNAEKRIKLSLALSPDDNEKAHYLLFRIAWAKGDVLQAAREYLEILNMNSTEQYAQDSLSRRELPFLLAATRIFVNESSNDPMRIAYYSSILFSVGHYKEAYLSQKRAAKLDEDQEELLSMICVRLGLFDEAETIMLRQLKQDSTQHFAAANNYMHGGQYEKAIEQLKFCLSENSAEYVYRNISRSYLQLGRYEEAMRYMDTAIVLADKNSIGTMLFNRGELYDCMNQPDKARADYLEALNNVESPLTKAYINALLGKADELQQYVDSVRPDMHSDDQFLTLAELYACLNAPDSAVHYMRLAFEHGQCSFSRYNAFRYRTIERHPAWLALMSEMEQARLRDIDEILQSEQIEAGESGVTEIPFKKQSGVNQVQCTINGLQLYFVFDTGASDVTLSNVEANFMLRNGYLTEADFMGKQNYVTATGEIHEGTVINLREVRVGDIVLTNIKASIVKNQNAPLLLGQSVFRRFGRVEVDNTKSVIRFVK